MSPIGLALGRQSCDFNVHHQSQCQGYHIPRPLESTIRTWWLAGPVNTGVPAHPGGWVAAWFHLLASKPARLAGLASPKGTAGWPFGPLGQLGRHAGWVAGRLAFFSRSGRAKVAGQAEPSPGQTWLHSRVMGWLGLRARPGHGPAQACPNDGRPSPALAQTRLHAPQEAGAAQGWAAGRVLQRPARR